MDSDDALDFNYRLSQKREKTAAMLRIPHPSEDQDKWDRLPPGQRAKILEAPTADAQIEDRLGKHGGSFTLHELAQEFLRPLQLYNFRAVQDKFSVYTVARVGDEIDFDHPEARSKVSPFLSAFAQLEEPGHASALVDSISVTNAFLNRKHWVGIGLLSAANIVADQAPTTQVSRNRSTSKRSTAAESQKIFL
jgi:hypothetical protein